MPALLCLGCDEDLGHRAADRRAFQGLPAEGVVNPWKAMFENATMQVEIDDDDRLCRHPSCWWRSPRKNVQKVLFGL